MEHRAGSEENNLRRPPPVPEALARQVLAYEAAAHPHANDTLAVAGHAYERLRARLTIFLGEIGFDALWARALFLALRSFQSMNEPVEEHAATLPPGVAIAIAGRDANEVHAVLSATFASFFALLFSFIGEDISLRLIHQLWPELPFDAADVLGEEGKP